MVKRSREASPPPSSSPSPTSDSSAIPEPINQYSSALTQTHPTDTSPHTSKYLHISPEALTAAATAAAAVRVMKCSLPPHRETLEFSTFEEFEIHYAKSHANRCSECRRNFPTEHFLGLHIAENHDPLSEARRAKGEKTYSCFVEDCDKICSNPTKRRMHLIDKHTFPKNYDFLIVNSGIDKRSSMLRSRHRKLSSAASRAFSRDQKPAGSSSGSKPHEITQADAPAGSSKLHSSPPTDFPASNISAADPSRTSISISISSEKTQESPTSFNDKFESTTTSQPEPVDAALEELSSKMSTLRFVPPSVRFGRGGRRGGLSRS